MITNSHIIKVVDRDGKSDEEIEECNANQINVLGKRHIECYLLDDEILKKLCEPISNLSRILLAQI